MLWLTAFSTQPPCLPVFSCWYTVQEAATGRPRWTAGTSGQCTWPWPPLRIHTSGSCCPSHGYLRVVQTSFNNFVTNIKCVIVQQKPDKWIVLLRTLRQHAFKMCNINSTCYSAHMQILHMHLQAVWAHRRFSYPSASGNCQGRAAWSQRGWEWPQGRKSRDPQSPRWTTELRG